LALFYLLCIFFCIECNFSLEILLPPFFKFSLGFFKNKESKRTGLGFLKTFFWGKMVGVFFGKMGGAKKKSPPFPPPWGG